MIETDNLYFDYYVIPNGWGALLVSARGVKSLILPVQKREVLERLVLNKQPEPVAKVQECPISSSRAPTCRGAAIRPERSLRGRSTWQSLLRSFAFAQDDQNTIRLLRGVYNDVHKTVWQQAQPGCRYFSADNLNQLKNKLYHYFSGKKVNSWDIFQELDLAGFSDSEREVFKIVYSIPYGTIWNYRQVAEAMGKHLAWRAIGNALAKNNIPIIIPCHRVIKSDYSLGGFSAGLEWKARLLELEGIVVSSKNKYRID